MRLLSKGIPTDNGLHQKTTTVLSMEEVIGVRVAGGAKAVLVRAVEDMGAAPRAMWVVGVIGHTQAVEVEGVIVIARPSHSILAMVVVVVVEDVAVEWDVEGDAMEKLSLGKD